MNTATFAGRLGRDAETKDTTSSTVTNFSIAVDVGFGDNKRTLWVACSMWGERGEKVAPYLTKGTPVTVSGDVDLRQYEKRDGSAGAELTLNVQRLTLQGRGRDEESTAGRSSGSTSPSRSAAAPEGASGGKGEGNGDFDDEIPF